MNRCICSLLVVALCSSASAQDKLELRLRLKKGDAYRLKLTVEQHVMQTPPAASSKGGQKQPAPPPPQAIDQMLGVGYTMTVDDVDAEGAMTIATRYEAVVLRQKGPAGNTEYDSASPPRQVSPSAKPFAVLPGLSFRMTLTPEGGVKSVDGVDEMIAEMVRRLELP